MGKQAKVLGAAPEATKLPAPLTCVTGAFSVCAVGTAGTAGESNGVKSQGNQMGRVEEVLCSTGCSCAGVGGRVRDDDVLRVKEVQ